MWHKPACLESSLDTITAKKVVDYFDNLVTHVLINTYVHVHVTDQDACVYLYNIYNVLLLSQSFGLILTYWPLSLSTNSVWQCCRFRYIMIMAILWYFSTGHSHLVSSNIIHICPRIHFRNLILVHYHTQNLTIGDLWSLRWSII